MARLLLAQLLSDLQAIACLKMFYKSVGCTMDCCKLYMLTPSGRLTHTATGGFANALMMAQWGGDHLHAVPCHWTFEVEGSSVQVFCFL